MSSTTFDAQLDVATRVAGDNPHMYFEIQSLNAYGEEALQALSRQVYDVVLIDVQMPEMDGLETTQQIRSRFPEYRQPRVVAMTANALQGDRGCVLKPGWTTMSVSPSV